jgi:transglutaminase-like putative cysteine protease
VYLDGGASTQLSGALLDIPSGAAGIRATLKIMRELVREYKTNVQIRDFAARLVQDLPQKDWAGQVERLHAFARDGVRYVDGVETVQTPLVTLQVRYGDCDDKATLLATMLKSIGHPARFVAVGFTEPGRFSHVYVETLIGRRWIPLETTMPVAAGWNPPRIVARMIQNA